MADPDRHEVQIYQLRAVLRGISPLAGGLRGTPRIHGKSARRHMHREPRGSIVPARIHHEFGAWHRGCIAHRHSSTALERVSNATGGAQVAIREQ
jgi:hypothetical protein